MISETKIINGQILVNINIDDYEFIHMDSKSKAGGVGIYVKKGVSFSIRDDYLIRCRRCENLWIEVQGNRNKKYIYEVIYRHPSQSTGELEDFKFALMNVIENIQKNKLTFYAFGDFNINLLKYDTDNKIKQYVDQLISLSCKLLIHKPTRVTPQSATLIDHIVTNDLKNSIRGIIQSDIGNHFPYFALIKCVNKKKKTSNNVKNKVRYLSNINLEIFLEDLTNELTDLIPIKCKTTKNLFNNLITKFNNILDKHAPFIQLSKKKTQNNQKPWLTSGILKSIKKKNKCFEN